MPPSIGSRCTLVVDGYTYEARVTDVEATAERDAVHGSRGPIGFTSGMTETRVTLTLADGPVRDGRFAEALVSELEAAADRVRGPRGAIGQTGPIGATGATGAAPPSPTWSDIEVSVNGTVITPVELTPVEGREATYRVVVTQPELETDEELRERLVRHAPFAIGQVGYYHSPQSFGVAAGGDLDHIAGSYGLERQLREPPTARATTKDITNVNVVGTVTEPPKTRYELIREATL